MPVPEITSAEALDRYAVGKKIAASTGPAWKDVQLSVFSLPRVAKVFTMPAITEPLIVWITSGEAEAQERENNGPWLTTHLKKGSLYLTAAGAPYDFRWRTLSREPFEIVLVFLSVPLFNEALEDVRNRVSALGGELPRDADPPMVTKFDTERSGVITISFASPPVQRAAKQWPNS